MEITTRQYSQTERVTSLPRLVRIMLTNCFLNEIQYIRTLPFSTVKWIFTLVLIVFGIALTHSRYDYVKKKAVAAPKAYAQTLTQSVYIGYKLVLFTLYSISSRRINTSLFLIPHVVDDVHDGNVVVWIPSPYYRGATVFTPSATIDHYGRITRLPELTSWPRLVLNIVYKRFLRLLPSNLNDVIYPNALSTP